MARKKSHLDELHAENRKILTEIVNAITNATAAAKEVTDKVEHDLQTHQILDDARFDKILLMLKSAAEIQEAITADVKSLLQSRSFQRGAWKAVSVVGGIAGTTAAILVAILKYIWIGH